MDFAILTFEGSLKDEKVYYTSKELLNTYIDDSFHPISNIKFGKDVNVVFV